MDPDYGGSTSGEERYVVDAEQRYREAAVRYGHPLSAGEIVLSGALGPMHTLASGDHVVAEMSGLGRVAMTFGPATAGRGRAGGDASDAGTIAEPVG